jgi:hypothetical protein
MPRCKRYRIRPSIVAAVSQCSARPESIWCRQFESACTRRAEAVHGPGTARGRVPHLVYGGVTAAADRVGLPDTGMDLDRLGNHARASNS